MVKRCPRCRLINPPEAERCDCGWDFVTQTQERSYIPRRHLPVGAAVVGGGTAAIVLLKLVLILVKLANMH